MTETAKDAARRLSAPMLNKGFKPEALHHYHDEAGTVLYSRIRVKHPETGEKWIRPMHLNGNGYQLGEPKFNGPKPLYNLHRLAKYPEARVFVVEGEKAADALARFIPAIVATTSGGAESAERADWAPLKGRNCTIWRDRDEAGIKYAEDVARILRAQGSRPGVVSVEAIGVPEKGDAADWMAAHPKASPDELLALPLVETPAPEVSEAQPEVPRATEGAPASPRGILDGPRIIALEIGDLLAREFPAKEPFLAPWLRRQDLAMVYAKRGVGKTHFCLALAYAVASGGSFLAWKAPIPRRVLYIDGEMPGATMKERLAALAQSQEAEPPEGFFRIVTPDAQELPLPDLATREGQEELAPIIGDAELIVLDNLSSLMRAGVENEGEAWVPMATWALARRREGRAVLFVHHGGKNGQQRGSSRREDLLDVSMQLKHPGDYTPDQGARFEVTFEKARGLFGEAVQPIEAALDQGQEGRVWTWKPAEGATIERVAKLEALGMSAAEIAAELGLHRSSVYRAMGKKNQPRGGDYGKA
jgi:hypothetical protein